MVFLLHHLPPLPLVAATGLAGLALGVLSTLLQDRRTILATQAGASALFVVHFFALGAHTGMLMCALGLVQMAAAYPERRPRWLGAVFAATVPAALAVAAATWQGPMSALSAAGFVLGTVGRWQSAVGRMRLFFLSSTLVGAGHNALAGSAFGLASDALTLSGHLLGLWRDGPPRCGRGQRLASAVPAVSRRSR
ncbi:YgjV family protein [Azospirillum isscasi]|uniref:YgjV family protein n=1 Tax=Azospirillum isscasi TaxID=3053926 RepID=A0ABU0WIU4_9PROT|nr:YgjV family protein [Azospirillum isscasi]MDQ2104081.1 YgjV family protein [Azospirillum isscasi]